MITLQLATESDWPAIWSILEPVFRAGETYAFSPAITSDEAHRAWMELPAATYVARDARGALLGTYYLKPNQTGLGDHVCNCGYVVVAAARGQGVAAAMCVHSQDEAVRAGFRAMQFNLVVSTNTVAVKLWQKLGFALVGTLPGAFRHLRLGFVDAHVMFKRLVVD